MSCSPLGGIVSRVLELGLPVVLASASPRRRELLATLIREFEVVVSDVPEDVREGETPREAAERLAKAKAEAVFRIRPDALVIAGDTVVAIEEPKGQWRLLGKPESESQAIEMLEALSGRDHEVISAICLAWHAGSMAFSEATRVRFRNLEFEEIEAYVATGEPMDKAGGYAIQGGAADFVRSIDGSLSNVIGLPMEKLASSLAAMRAETK